MTSALLKFAENNCHLTSLEEGRAVNFMSCLEREGQGVNGMSHTEWGGGGRQGIQKDKSGEGVGWDSRRMLASINYCRFKVVRVN